ncbi:hypothetical protein J8J14_09540 [Roseomonas sp. SSH11]|uniref:Uncharacterized protein n=1 Tax=Pararoseomonas baculiformis TaxID=2820812 RepID=A0ABS4ADD8_9PROT|nr:hypothetical protein [Pararoseomonas baculiformis]MBP0445022.1 hypothetical protein [Pararoseomonas baculiformis]
MSGFLPMWLAIPGVIAAGAMTLAVTVSRCGIPLWLLPLVLLLAVGTWS